MEKICIPTDPPLQRGLYGVIVLKNMLLINSFSSSFPHGKPASPAGGCFLPLHPRHRRRRAGVKENPYVDDVHQEGDYTVLKVVSGIYKFEVNY